MAAIYEEVRINWDGEEYKITPTYRMIQQIEQNISIAGVSARIASGNPPISHMAEIIAILLRNAGAKVSPDKVYEVMLTEMTDKEIGDMTSIIMSAFVPRSKNSDSPGKNSEPGKKKRGRPPKTSTGQSTTE